MTLEQDMIGSGDRFHTRRAGSVGGRIVALLGVAVTVASSVNADTLEVPGDYPTIQAAIDAASAGDVVQVAAGTYVERINTAGKAIRIRGTVDDAGDPITILDGDAGGSVVTIDSGETEKTIIESLLLTNGSAHRGGGAYVGFTSRARFENCHFIDNVADYGGGFCSWASRLVGCRVEGNRCNFNFPVNASGVLRFDGANAGVLRVEDCYITGNGTPGQQTFAIGIFGDGFMQVDGTTVCGNLNGECMGFDCQGSGNYVDEDCLPPSCPPSAVSITNNASLALSDRGNRCECVKPDYHCGSYPGEWAVVYDLSLGETAGRSVVINCLKYGTYNDDGATPGKIHLRADVDGGDPDDSGLVDIATIDVQIPTAGAAMNLLILDPPVEIPANTRLVLSLEAGWAPLGYLSIRGNDSPSASETYYRDVQTFCSTEFRPLDVFGYPALNWVTEIDLDVLDTPCPGDINGDGRVDGADLPQILANWGPCDGDCPADLDGNGIVNGGDLSLVLSGWGLCG